MNMLFTGGSSPLGARVLAELLKDERLSIWASVHERSILLEHARLHCIQLDIESPDLTQLPAPLDRVIHFAAVTHAADPRRYTQVNDEGTTRLAAAARKLGCKNFVYVSTRCATSGSGAYGESKLSAENKLRAMGFDSLLILRPAEIYGGGGNEGIDRLITLAAKWHIVPLMFGDRRLRLSPLFIDDFVTQTVELIDRQVNGEQIAELCGPENLSGASVAMRIAHRYYALPLPLWWPGLVFGLKILGGLGMSPIKSDQLYRAVGEKTCYQSANTGLKHFLS
jgi:nucleoside-diphosphate-sugar epimerase